MTRLGALAHPPFARLLSGQLVSSAGTHRFSRRTLVTLTLAAEAGQAFALAAITVAGDLRPWMLYLAAVADAGRLAVNIPAQSALVPNVVPAALLPSAMALSASVWSSAALAGRPSRAPC